MNVKNAVFKGSFVKAAACPAGNLPEFAFIGRSNVGKSSLINMLCLKKDLVKISRSPGKTRTMNYFLVNDQMYFVDLPGYGYAKRSQKERGQWGDMIIDYLSNRRQLYCLFVLIDSRIPPQKIDLDFINELGSRELPFVLVFTKADKRSNHQLQITIRSFLKLLASQWETMPLTFVTSSIAKTGREDLLKFIEASSASAG